MPITTVVLDWNYKPIERFVGKYREGVLLHPVGVTYFGIPFVAPRLIKWGGSNEEMEFDYQKTVDLGGNIGRVAIYLWDGSNYSQLSFYDVPESSTLSQFMNSWERAKMAEEITDPKPKEKFENLKTLFQILVPVACMVAIYIVASNASSKISSAAAPFSKIANTTAGELGVQQMEIRNLTSLIKAVVPYVQNASGYISSQRNG